jgi:thymidylate synthase (FAD)
MKFQKGHEKSQEWKNKISKANKGKKKNYPVWNKGLTGKEYIQHYKNGHPKGMKGKKPWNFINGLSKNRFNESREWLEIAKKCYARDNYKCKTCGSIGKNLHAHHVIPWSISQNDNLDNLITLCAECHRRLHSSEIKRGKDGRWEK